MWNWLSAILSLGLLVGIQPRLILAEESLPNEACVVISRVNGFTLDVRGADNRPLTLVQTAGFGQQKNREWTFTRIKPNVYAMKAEHCGAYADIRDRGGERARLQIGDSDPSQDNRHFIVRRSPSNYYTLAAEHSGLLLDVVDAGGWKAEVQTAGTSSEIQTNREWLIVPSKMLDEQEVFTYENRVYLRLNLQAVKEILQSAANSSGFKINYVGLGEGNRQGVGGLRCELSNSEGDAVIVLQPRTWRKPVCAIDMELVSTRANDLLKEFVKALVNYDEMQRKTLIPAVESKINDAFKSLQLVADVKIEVIGIRTDGLVLVSTSLPAQVIARIEELLAKTSSKR